MRDVLVVDYTFYIEKQTFVLRKLFTNRKLPHKSEDSLLALSFLDYRLKIEIFDFSLTGKIWNIVVPIRRNR